MLDTIAVTTALKSVRPVVDDSHGALEYDKGRYYAWRQVVARIADTIPDETQRLEFLQACDF